MADKKITELQLVSAISDDLNLPVDDTLQTYRATIAQIKAYLAPVYVPPSTQYYTSGTGTHYKHYTFLCGSASATVGATYTNNGITYTVIKTIASKTQVVLSGSGAPTASGILTKASGTGDVSITFTLVRVPIRQKGRAVGAGGGGGGSGTGISGGTGTNGGNTTFGTSLIVCNGGAGATQYVAGAGGTASLGSGPIGKTINGMKGHTGQTSLATQSLGGGQGADTLLGIGGTGVLGIGNGALGWGAGGAGGGSNGALNTGAGGSAGGYSEWEISGPNGADILDSYAYAVGANGSGGGAGTTGYDAGPGAPGLIELTYEYQ